MRDYDLPPVRRTHQGQPAVPDQRPAAEAATGVDARFLGLQRLIGNSGVAQFLGAQGDSPEHDDARSPVLDVIGGGGVPLEEKTRATMETRLGGDFRDTRIHTDGRAAASAHSVNAQAYTVGRDVVFAPGKYDPRSPAGQRTLAHELTHVIQQANGPTEGTPAPGGIRVSDPSDRFERAAEHAADRVMSGGATSTGGGTTASASSAVQRQAEEEEASVQPQIQRQAEEEGEGEERAGA